MITDEQIRGVIDNCHWAQKFYDYAICPLLVEPCISGVNKGRCPELQKLFFNEHKKKATEPLVKLDPDTLRDPFDNKDDK